jgi:hypothetical protein
MDASHHLFHKWTICTVFHAAQKFSKSEYTAAGNDAENPDPAGKGYLYYRPCNHFYQLGLKFGERIFVK